MGYTVYEYGIKRITAGEELLRDQLYKRHRYWNRLVEIEKQYRSELDAIYGLVDEVCDGDEAAFKEAVKSDAVKALMRESELRRREAARQARPRQKDAVEDMPLYWGTYSDVEQSYKTQRVKKGRQLKFHRPVPEGAVSVWPSNGGKNLPISAIWGEDSMLQLETPNEQNPRGRRGNTRTTGRLRVGTEGRKPLYVEFQTTLHRPLPPVGILRHASIVRRRVASQYKHTLTITVEMLEAKAIATQAITLSQERPAAGIDIGWRLFPEHVRIGYLADSLGHVEELRIPRRILTALEKCDDIKSIRDNLFNVAKAGLTQFVEDPSRILPDWFRAGVKTLKLWRSQGRLAGLALKWRDNRFPGDDAAYEAAEAWRVRDKHLWEYEANLRDRAGRWRRECYRKLAARLAQTYGMIGVEEFNLADIAQEDDTPQAASRARARSAVGEFRRILEITAAREGVVVRRIPAAYTTRTCHRCESLCAFDAKADLSHLCEHCGADWDQDENAARNLLREGMVEAPLAEAS